MRPATRVLHRILPALLLGVAACSMVDPTGEGRAALSLYPITGTQRLTAVFSDQPGTPVREKRDVQVDGLGLAFERDGGSGQAFVMATEFRAYELDDFQSSLSLEVRPGLRRFLFHDYRLRPFVQGNGVFGLGTDSLYLGVTLQSGLSWQFAETWGIEAGAAWETFPVGTPAFDVCDFFCGGFFGNLDQVDEDSMSGSVFYLAVRHFF